MQWLKQRVYGEQKVKPLENEGRRRFRSIALQTVHLVFLRCILITDMIPLGFICSCYARHLLSGTHLSLTSDGSLLMTGGYEGEGMRKMGVLKWWRDKRVKYPGSKSCITIGEVFRDTAHNGSFEFFVVGGLKLSLPPLPKEKCQSLSCGDGRINKSHAFEKPCVSEENEGIPRTLLDSSGQRFFLLVQDDRAVMT